MPVRRGCVAKRHAGESGGGDIHPFSVQKSDSGLNPHGKRVSVKERKHQHTLLRSWTRPSSCRAETGCVEALEKPDKLRVECQLVNSLDQFCVDTSVLEIRHQRFIVRVDLLYILRLSHEFLESLTYVILRILSRVYILSHSIA